MVIKKNKNKKEAFFLYAVKVSKSSKELYKLTGL